eukprot:m.260134 g.260134  ORF g.260134 m.260134 type:complete len:299 (-) comp39270_c0_seq1:46-942(-)
MATESIAERLRKLPRILKKAGWKALGGGIPGAAAMILQVLLLMWLRTTINYIHRNGGTMGGAFAHLYEEGGIGRFYQGVGLALFQGPLSRFGDTAANEGTKELLSGLMGVSSVTFVASMVAGLWRVFLAPVDTLKTTMQVHGLKGLNIVMERVATEGPLMLYSGALGTWASTSIGYYPWFWVYNYLNAKLPKAESAFGQLCQSAFIGLCSSVFSDIISNSVRVVTTVKKTSLVDISYFDAAMHVIEEDGLAGLMVRGLSVKVISNGISSILFSILWKYFMKMWENRGKKPDSDLKKFP